MATFLQKILGRGIIGVSSPLTEKETRNAWISQSEEHQKKPRYIEIKNLFKTIF